VIILSYFYPPCNLAASNRAVSWAKGLPGHGIRPVVLTRSWTVPVNRLEDVTIASGTDVVDVQHDGYRVVSLPYSPILKDRWNPTGPMRWAKKALSMASVVLQHMGHRTSEYGRFYAEGLRLAAEERPDLVMVTGNPWGMFRIAHDLSRDTGIPWVADYRDIWTANGANIVGLPWPYRLLHNIERWFERRLVSKAKMVTSISLALAKECGNHVGRPYAAIYNGYNEEEFVAYRGLPKNDRFSVTYVGTLYHGQDVSVLARAAKRLIDVHGRPADIYFKFLGTGFNAEQRARLNSLFAGYESHVEVTDRTDRATTLATEARSHLLVHVGWAGYSGIVGSKIYEYMASGTPILICPTDGDILEEMVGTTNTGQCAKDENDAFEILNHHYQKYKKGEVLRNDPESQAVRAYSRSAQVAELARLIKYMTGSGQ
jgi:glycosyltransferase involved in cell wall biosynthesis